MAKIYTVEGHVHIKYKDKKTGDEREAEIMHCSFDSDDRNFTGREVQQFFIPDGITDYIPLVGDKVCIYFNQRGFIDDVVPYVG